ncbi:PH domain-containing protein [Flavobacterium sp.]|uniref:PH domain-containing protein n=1 Tax=Flavobacterium sp. TaxID=239 RepID=UPI0028BDFACB|nr:PH domain-containing protein [Flavobacterium sp.]
MQNFTNETINISELPKYEEVALQPLHSDYWKVILIGNFIFLGILSIIAGIVLFFNEEARDYWYIFALVVAVIFLFSVFLGRVSFRKRGFAFRQHDVLYKNGIISETTTIIPFNRIQHVALHEGVFARIFGLASIGIYTAGGGDSDIDIPGIEKEKALQIKQLLMTKLTDETQQSSENDGESEL